MSFETLFEVLMREKNREELQRLDQDFYDEAIRFIAGEERLVRPSNHVGFQRVRNLRNMLRELYSRREQKIIRLATMSSRGSTAQVDRAAMLDHEKALFTELSQTLETTRKRRLEAPVRGPARPKQEPQVRKEPETAREDPPSTPDAEPARSEPAEAGSGPVLVTFTKPVGKFIGEELEPYGPYDAGDTARVPRSIADILVQKGEARLG